MSKFYKEERDFEVVAKEISALTLKQIQSLFSIENYYDVFIWLDEFFYANGKLTRAGLSEYLGITKQYASRLINIDSFPAKTFEVANRKFSYIEIDDFWKWVKKHPESINLSLVKVEVIEQQNKSIKRRFQESCLVCKRNSNWSEPELEFLQEHWGEFCLQHIAFELERTHESVRAKALQLELGSATKSSGNYLTCRDLIKEMGYSADVTKKWEEQYDMPVILRRMIRKRGQQKRYVEVTEFWEWVKTHTEIIDLTRFKLEKLVPIPDWFFRERDHQVQAKKEKELLTRKWSHLDKLKLVKLHFHEGIGMIRISKVLDRNLNNVKSYYKKLQNTSEFQSLVDQSVALDLAKCGISLTKRTASFTEEQKLLILYLSTLPDFYLPTVAEVLGMPYSSLRARFNELINSEEYALLLTKVKTMDFSTYDNVFAEYEAMAEKRRWTAEEDEKLLYCIDIEKVDWQEASKLFNRTNRTVKRRYNFLKKQQSEVTPV